MRRANGRECGRAFPVASTRGGLGGDGCRRRRAGFGGPVLRGIVGIVDDRENLAGGDAVADVMPYLRDPPRDLEADPIHVRGGDGCGPVVECSLRRAGRGR